MILYVFIYLIHCQTYTLSNYVTGNNTKIQYIFLTQKHIYTQERKIYKNIETSEA